MAVKAPTSKMNFLLVNVIWMGMNTVGIFEGISNIQALAEMSKDFRDNQASNYNHYTDTDVGNADANNLGYVVRRNFSRNGGNQTLHIPLSQMFGSLLTPC